MLTSSSAPAVCLAGGPRLEGLQLVGENARSAARVRQCDSKHRKFLVKCEISTDLLLSKPHCRCFPYAQPMTTIESEDWASGHRYVAMLSSVFPITMCSVHGARFCWAHVTDSPALLGPRIRIACTLGKRVKSSSATWSYYARLCTGQAATGQPFSAETDTVHLSLLPHGILSFVS